MPNEAIYLLHACMHHMQGSRRTVCDTCIQLEWEGFWCILSWSQRDLGASLSCTQESLLPRCTCWNGTQINRFIYLLCLPTLIVTLIRTMHPRLRMKHNNYAELLHATSHVYVLPRSITTGCELYMCQSVYSHWNSKIPWHHHGIRNYNSLRRVTDADRAWGDWQI